jgi:hypothetical protein
VQRRQQQLEPGSDPPPPTSTPAPTPAHADPNANIDPDIFNFALNLEYLEAQFYVFAVSGTGIAGQHAERHRHPRQRGLHRRSAVPFQDPVVRAYAREIAADEEAHVAFCGGRWAPRRSHSRRLTSGWEPATSAFANAARAAGIDPASFIPYADDNSFLLGAFIFEDVGVTA